MESPSFDKLKSMYAQLEKRVSRFSAVEQELINAKNDIDKELAIFKTIQIYSEKALKSNNLSDFGTITVESLVEAFQLESAVLLKFNTNTETLQTIAHFGFESISQDHFKMKHSAFISNGFSETFIETSFPFVNNSGFPEQRQVIYCTFYGLTEGEFGGILLGGRSVKNQAYYDEIKTAMCPSFSVFTQQMNSLLINIESRRRASRQADEIAEAQALFAASFEQSSAGIIIITDLHAN